MTPDKIHPNLRWSKARPFVLNTLRNQIINGLRATGRRPIKSKLRDLESPDCFCVQGAVCDIIDPKAWEGKNWCHVKEFPASVTATGALAISVNPLPETPYLDSHESPNFRLLFELFNVMIEANDYILPSFAEQADFFEQNTRPY